MVLLEAYSIEQFCLLTCFLAVTKGSKKDKQTANLNTRELEAKTLVANGSISILYFKFPIGSQVVANRQPVAQSSVSQIKSPNLGLLL